MAFGDSDLSVFFADMGETAIWNGQTLKCFVDETSMPWQGGGFGSMEETVMRVTAPITSFASLPVPGQAFTVRGSSWTISRRSRPGDGQIVELELKATA